MRALSRGLAAAALVAGALLVAGCTQGPPAAKAYVFHPGSSPIKVDTPALRAQKAAAHIADCPRSTRVASAGPHRLPAVTLPCLGGGRSVDLAGLAGPPTIVNFWSQSCGPCRTELPLLQRFSVAARGTVRMVGVDWEDSQPGMAIAFAKALGVRYAQLADPDAATRAPLQISGLPTSIFVDSTGTIVHVEYGALTSAAELKGLVKTYLGVSVPLGTAS